MAMTMAAIHVGRFVRRSHVNGRWMKGRLYEIVLPPGSSARAKSPTVANRSTRSLAIAFASAALTWLGTAGRACCARGGGWIMW
jgi:hypothetical protein